MKAIKEQGRVNYDDPHIRLAALIALAEMPKLAGIQMWATYKNLDKWSQQAYAKAQAGAGISEVADKPAIPPLLQPVAVRLPRNAALALAPFRFFATTGGGLRLPPHPALPPGVLRFFNLRGTEVARARYDGIRWLSFPEGLGVGVYAYAFEGPSGMRQSGRVVPAPRP